MVTHTIPIGDAAILPMLGSANGGVKVYEYNNATDAQTAYDSLRFELDNGNTPEVPFTAPDGISYQLTRGQILVLKYIGKCLIIMWLATIGIPYIP